MPTSSPPAKTRQQVAVEYGVCVSTLKRWLKKRNVAIPAGLLYPKDQRRIYVALGKPK